MRGGFLLLLMLSGSAVAQAQEECPCVPNYRGTTTNLKWTVNYRDESATPDQRKYFEEQVLEASKRWNLQFERRKVEPRVTRDDKEATVILNIDPNRTELPYNFVSHIDFGPAYLQADTLGTARVIADIQHEFGHSLGFADAGTCTGSIMSQITPYIPVIDLDFSDCDYKMMFDANFVVTPAE
jgi:hypothetical protein